MVKFIADSSCDIKKIDGVNFQSVPLTISTDSASFVDDETINIHEMLDTLASYRGRSFTACPGINAWLQAFEGADTIYVVTITSRLSGTYNSAVRAGVIYLQEHPEAKIHIFDTLSTGAEMRLLIEKLVELSAAGLDFENVCFEAERYMKRTRLFFVLRSLHNMAQNGRVSKVVAATVGVLGIRILGTASAQGELEPVAKCRGDKKAVDELIRQVEKTGFKKGKLRLGHTENPELMEIVKDRLKKRFPLADIVTYETGGLCSYYGERGAVFLGVEA